MRDRGLRRMHRPQRLQRFPNADHPRGMPAKQSPRIRGLRERTVEGLVERELSPAKRPSVLASPSATTRSTKSCSDGRARVPFPRRKPSCRSMSVCACQIKTNAELRSAVRDLRLCRCEAGATKSTTGNARRWCAVPPTAARREFGEMQRRESDCSAHARMSCAARARIAEAEPCSRSSARTRVPWCAR